MSSAKPPGGPAAPVQPFSYAPMRQVDPADAAPGIAPWSSPYRHAFETPPTTAPTWPAAPELVAVAPPVREPEATIVPEPEATIVPEPEATIAPEREAVIVPEPEATIAPEPEAVIAPEPEAVIAPEPEAVIAPEPEAVIAPEPKAAIVPEPAAVIVPEPEAAGWAAVAERAIPPADPTDADPAALPPRKRLESLFVRSREPALPRARRAASPGRPTPARRRLRLAGFGLLVVAVPLAGAAFMLLPGAVLRPPAATAVFTAPTLVLRAAVAGRVISIDTARGAAVQPESVLLTIHADPRPDPAAEALRSRLVAARARVEALDAQLAPTPAAATAGIGPMAEARWSRLADLRRLRAGAAVEREQLERAVAAIPVKGPADLVIRARVRGYVRMIEATAGEETVVGAPMMQLTDCDHAFLVPSDGGTRMHAGERVELRIAGMPAFYGQVRPAAGISEPPGSLVIDPTGLSPASPGACPMGATATIIAAPVEG